MNQAIRCLVAPLVAAMCSVAIAADRPNILVIWGDDVGWENVSAYGMGVMGYTTPNLDSIGMGVSASPIIMRSLPARRDAPPLSRGSTRFVRT